MNRRRNKRRSSFVHHQLAKCVKNNDPQQCSRQQLPQQQKPQHPQQHQLKSMPLRNEGALHQYVKLLSAEGLIEESTSTSSVKRSKLETTRHYNQCLPQFNMKTSQSSYESPPGSSTSVSFLNNLVHFTQHNLDTYVATASSLHNMPHTPLGSVKQPRNNQICTSSIHQRRPFSSTENPIVWTPPSSSSSSSSSSSTSSSSSSSSSSSPNAKSSSATFNKKCCCGIPMLGRATRKRSSLDIDIVSASHSLSSNMCIDITHMCLSWAHAATLGCSSSQFNLAKCFAMGHGVRADARQAFKLYTLAASHGYAPASYQLGMSYKLGVGVKRDNNLALHHFREAARVGVVRANYEVALYYEQRGELSQAIHHYGIAAKTGHIADAQYALARCYEDGIGTFQNRIEAMHWYNLAAAQGHRMAQISSLNTMLTTPNNTLPNSMDYRAQHDLNTNRTASLSLTSSSLSSLQVQENDYDDDDDDDDDDDIDDDDDTDNNDKVRASNKSDDTTTEPLVRPDTLINDVERITINQHTEPLQKVQKTQRYNNDIQFVQN